MSRCAFQDARSSSAPSTIRNTWWCGSPASCSKPRICSSVPAMSRTHVTRCLQGVFTVSCSEPLGGLAEYRDSADEYCGCGEYQGVALDDQSQRIAGHY